MWKKTEQEHTVNKLLSDMETLLTVTVTVHINTKQFNHTDFAYVQQIILKVHSGLIISFHCSKLQNRRKPSMNH